MNDCCEPDLSGNSGEYDLCVIGAGSAGFSAAITAAEQDARIALVGHGTIGGTCVNVGCVPSKTLIRAAEALHHARGASRFAGVAGEARLTDWKALINQKDELVSQLRQSKYIDLLKEYSNIDYIDGRARFTGTGLRVNGEPLAAAKYIVATGSRPYAPDIPGSESVNYLTSTTAMELAARPGSLIVMGGGYVGCELAQMFARAGTEVTIVCRSRLLPAAEPEISDALARYLEEDGLRVLKGVEYASITQNDGGVSLEIRIKGNDETLRADHILVATGRTPNTECLGLEYFGVQTDNRRAIKTDERMRTSKSGVYAAGDVTGRDQFVYMAAYGGRVAAENALNGDGEVYDAAAMPAVVFTDPQVASVGLTEAQARAAAYDVKSVILPLDQVPRALAARDTRGLIKLVADRASDRLLGAHIVAPEGADGIQTAVLAIKTGMTVHDLARTIFPYLTTVEGLKLAAQAFEKDVTKLSCCAG